MTEPRRTAEQSATDQPYTREAGAAVRGTVALFLAQTIGRALALAFVLAIGRHVPAQEFGRYSTVAAIVLVATFAADFGTSPVITKLVARDPGRSDAILARTLVASAFLGTIAYLAAAAFALIIYGSTVRTDVMIGGAAVPGVSLLSSILGAMDGRGLIATRAGISLLQTAVVAIGGVVAVVSGAGIRGAVVALGMAPWVALAVASPLAWRHQVWRGELFIDLSAARELLALAAPFAAHFALYALMLRADVVILSMFRSRAETANYDLAQRFVEALMFVSAAISSPLLFVLSRRIGNQDVDGVRRAYLEGGRALYLLGVPMSICLAILAKPLVRLALGPGYGPVAHPLAIMGSAMWLLFLVHLQGVLVNAGDYLRPALRVAAINTAATLVFDIVLILRYGATGAAVAIVSGWIVSGLTYDLFHRRTSAVRTPLPPLGVVVGGAALTAVLLALRYAPLYLSVPAGAVAYVAALAACHTATVSDLHRFRLALRGAGRRW